MRRSVLLGLLAASVLLLAVLLTSCTLFVGNPSGLVPLPPDVGTLSPPRILSCDATVLTKSCEDLYERVCGWFYWTVPWVQTPAAGWSYGCRNAWRETACWCDILLRLTVSDPSDDLDPRKSPRVRVLDSEPAPGGTGWGECLLDIARTDVAIEATDVTGGGTTKTVTVRLRDVRVRFTATCRMFSAILRLAVAFQDGDEELTSENLCETIVEVVRP